MPEPIRPQPSTPTFLIAMSDSFEIARILCAQGARGEGREARERNDADAGYPSPLAPYPSPLAYPCAQGARSEGREARKETMRTRATPRPLPLTPRPSLIHAHKGRGVRGE